eukprot:5109721-Pyramimonas_sp.AAC.1
MCKETGGRRNRGDMRPTLPKPPALRLPTVDNSAAVRVASRWSLMSRRDDPPAAGIGAVMAHTPPDMARSDKAGRG